MHQLANSIFIIYFFYHVLVGIPGILSVNMTRKIAYKLYKLRLEDNLDLKYQYALKALGFYALYTAILCYIGFSIDDPIIKAKLLFALGFLTCLRAMGRLINRDLILKAFQAESSRNNFHVALNLIIGLGMFFVAWQLIK